MGVGRAVTVKGCSRAMAVTKVFRVRVARSSIRVRKLWTGRPSSVRPVVCLVTAAGERPALATTLERCASAASLSVSSFGAAFHFIVESLERIGAVQFAVVLLGEVEIIAAALPRCRRVRLEGAALPIQDRDRLAC
jgi:hypothetical protein